MSLKYLSLLLCVPFILSSFGCRTLSSDVTSANVTFPVILGPVKNIGGQPALSTGLTPATGNFEAETVESFFISVTPQDDGQTQTTAQARKDGTNRIDADIMKVAAQGDVVRAEDIYIGSYTFYMLFIIYQKAFAGIEGTVYNDTSHNSNPAN